MEVIVEVPDKLNLTYHIAKPLHEKYSQNTMETLINTVLIIALLTMAKLGSQSKEPING